MRRVKREAQQKIEQAKAEAEALRFQKQNVTPELVELRRIEAQAMGMVLSISRDSLASFRISAILKNFIT